MLQSIPPKGSSYPEIIIRSDIKSPSKALNIGEMMSNLRKEVEYALEELGNNKWRVILIRGRVEDLMKIINGTKSIHVTNLSEIPDCIDSESEEDDGEIDVSFDSYLPDVPTE